jgi:transcriptional regulator with XRE-family HTH domain
VKGLRREEVAVLAAISTDYYARIEQGRRHAPEPVLDAIARVLRLDPDEREYAFDVARALALKSARSSRPCSTRQQIPAGVQALMDAMVSAPATVQNGRLDIVGSNALGRALYVDAFKCQARRPNLARYVFLDARAADFYSDWDARPTTPSRSCASKQATRRTARTSPTSSGSSRHEAVSSRRVGPLTTFEPTAVAPSACTTRSWET